jgi:hypothetical protein
LPPPPIISSVRRPPVVSEFMLNSSIVHQRRHFYEISNFILSLPPSHPKKALGIARSDVDMANLVIADIPENLPVPNVSYHFYNVPSWNALDSDFLGELFDFADDILHDDNAELSSSFILMTMVTSGRALKTISLLLDSRSLRSVWESTVFAYLQLSIRLRYTNLFQVVLLVRATKTIGFDLDKRPRHSSFRLRDANELKALGIEFDMDDAIMNYTATPLMDSSKAWRGPREKDIAFMSSLIMATTDIGHVVVDVNAGVGMS